MFEENTSKNYIYTKYSISPTWRTWTSKNEKIHLHQQFNTKKPRRFVYSTWAPLNIRAQCLPMRKTAPLFHQRKKGTHEDIGDGGNGQEEPHETQP